MSLQSHPIETLVTPDLRPTTLCKRDHPEVSLCSKGGDEGTGSTWASGPPSSVHRLGHEISSTEDRSKVSLATRADVLS